MKRIILALTLCLLITASYAAEKNELDLLSEKYDEAMSSIMIAQRRLLNDSNKYEKQELDYSKLDSIYSSLAISQVQIDSINRQLMISGLVTDKKSKVYANKIIRLQKDTFAKQFFGQAEFCEKALTNIESSEATLLILKARDIFKESVKIIEQ